VKTLYLCVFVVKTFCFSVVFWHPEFMKLLAGLVPYVAVLVGMYLLHSAWAAVLLYHIGIVTFVLIFKAGDMGSKIKSGYKMPVLIPAVITCALTAPAVYFMWPWFSASEGILPEWLEKYGLTGLSWLVLIPYFSIIHPVLEEIHWRDIAPEPFKWICWQDLLFAGYHVLVLYQLLFWPWLFLVFGVLTGCSIFWRWSAGKFAGYGLAILTHAVADAGVVIGVLFLLNQ
jgi:hypothetical protein